MKNYISFLLLFTLLCFQAQLKDSLDFDKDGILNLNDKCIGIPGIPELDGCPKDWREYYLKNNLSKKVRICTSYEFEKKNYEIDKGQIDNTDFSGFFNELFKNEIFNLIKTNKRKIILLYNTNRQDGPECGNDPYYECPHYEKDIFDELNTMLWQNKNFQNFQKLMGDKIIIPLEKSSFNGNLTEKESFLLKNKIKPIYSGNYINRENEIKKFYYSTNQKPTQKLILNQDLHHDIKEEALSMSFSITPIRYKDFSNPYLVSLYLLDESHNLLEKKFYYQYTNNQWKLIEIIKE